MKNFISVLQRYQFKHNVLMITQFILAIVSILLIIFDTFLVLHHLLSIPPIFFFWLGISIKIVASCIILYLVLKMNRMWISTLQAAAYLDHYNHDQADTYQNAYELSNNSKWDNAILEKVVEPADRIAEKQEINITSNYFLILFTIFSVLFILNVSLFFMIPKQISSSWNFLKLRTIPEAVHKTSVEVLPGNKKMRRYESLMVEVENPEKEVKHTLFYRRNDKWREETLVNYRKKFNQVDFSFHYFVQTPYAVSDTFYVELFDLPSIEKLTVRYDYPNYTGYDDEIEKNGSGNVKALIGTRVHFEIESNNPLESCDIVYSDGKIENCLRKGKKTFSYSFTISKSKKYHFLLKDILGNTSEKIEKQIIAVSDEKPSIAITKPGMDTILTQNLLLPVTIFAHDDYGLEHLKVHHFINENSEIINLVSSRINSTSYEKEYVLDLTNTFLLPGDKVTYWASTGDNSPQKQIAVSQRYVARFPSIEEIYKEVEQEEAKKKEMLQHTFEKSQELQEEFEQKRREMMKKEEYNWDDKQQIQKFLKEQENLNTDIKNIAEDYSKMIEKMQQNQALTSETLEKMEKIKELMEDIADDQLMETMQKLQEKMGEMSPEDIKKAMEKMKFSMEDFAEKLEQTIKLLENIKKEQSLQKALEIAKEMENMQNDLLQRTKEENSSNLSDEQQAMKDKLESLEDQLAKSDSLLKKNSDQELKEAMQELQEQMKSDSLKQDLQKSSEMLEQNQPQQAMQSQQQAASKMQKMRKKLEEMMQMMSSSSSSGMGEMLDKTIQRLLMISQLQKRSEKQYTNDPFIILQDQIANFEGIQIILKELYSEPMILLVLGQKFVFDANKTIQSYRTMFTEINEAKKRSVPEYLMEIKKGINLMIYDLMQAKNNMQTGGGGGGMQSLMQSMQQMGEQQMMMNMLTQELMQQMMQDGKMNGNMRNQARKIAEQEERLAENLKRILQSDPDAQKQTAAMNQMIEELEQISRLLKRNKIDQSLLDRQEKILSRLLDAQKSIHKREFSKKRKSEVSEKDDWLLPEEVKLKFDKMRRKALLNNDLKSYPKAFQELIREYLKKVNEKASQNIEQE